MTEKRQKSIFNCESSKSRELLDEIQKIEAELAGLPLQTEWTANFPKEPTLESVRSALEANQKELHEELKKEVESITQTEPPSIYPISPPTTQKRSLAHKLKGIFTDKSCCEPLPDETLMIPASQQGADSGLISGQGNYGHWAFIRDQYTWDFNWWLQDSVRLQKKWDTWICKLMETPNATIRLYTDRNQVLLAA